MILECKQCGGQVSFEEGTLVSVCPFCGSQNTVGKSAEQQSGLVNRANYLRRNNEFDKAAAVYEALLRADNSDYEAHWGLVLCRYGIEYVEDPATCEQKPTCHRTGDEPIYTDLSYKAALEYAPLVVREVYEKEAAEIDAIQKNILALSRREEKFDVFLCYKEQDDAGNRTEDSVIAQELEFELARRGYRVFFARKTLEHVLGSAYEPIIYAALQSAKAMVVLGTKPEHFNAVWVRNEWGRYRELIKKGAQKVLIPAYRNMSPYDLPLELSNLQALDMGKLGFVQDLCDGIDRFTGASKRSEAQAAPAAIAAGPGVESLMKRALLFIEEGNDQKADEYIERVLDQNPEEPRAYMGKLLIELGLRTEGELKERTEPLDGHLNYQKAVRFATGELLTRYEGYQQAILDQIAQRDERLRAEREAALARQRAEEAARSAKLAAEKAERFERIQREAARMEEAARIRREKAKKFNKVFWPVVLIVTAAFLFFGVYLPKAPMIKGYQAAEALYESGDYAAAAKAFAEVSEYKDAATRSKEAGYQYAEELLEAGKYEDASAAFAALGLYSDAQACACDAIYRYAEAQLKAGEYAEALATFQNLGMYSDADTRVIQIRKTIYQNAIAAITAEKPNEAIPNLIYLGTYEDSEEQLLALAQSLLDAGDYGYALFAWQGGGSSAATSSRIKESVAEMRQVVLQRVSLSDTLLLGVTSESTVRALAYQKDTAISEEALKALADWTDIVKLSVSKTTVLGLRKNGTAVAVNLQDGVAAPDVSGWKKVNDIVALNGACFGATASGRMVYAGDLETLGIAEKTLRNWGDIASICGDQDYIVGLAYGGRVVALGNNDFGQCNVTDWRNITAVLAVRDDNFGYTLGVKEDASVVSAGSATLGQGALSSWTNIAKCASDGRTTLGLSWDGTVVLAGNSENGLLAARKWTDIVDIAMGGGQAVGLKKDGTVVATLDTFSGTGDIAAWTNIVAVWAGDGCVLGLDASGKLHMAGDGYVKISGASWELW